MTTDGHVDYTPAQAVQIVYNQMTKLGVSLADLELWGHIEDIGGFQDDSDPDLLYPVDETFNRVHADIDLNGGGAVEQYHQATAEYVMDRLAELDMLWGEGDGPEPEVFHCGFVMSCDFRTTSEDDLTDHLWVKHAIRATT